MSRKKKKGRKNYPMALGRIGKN